MSDDNLPAPLVPTDADLQGFDYTPIYRARLFGSAFHARATDAEWRAGVTLWLKSWEQVPAGSLPDDDIDLCRLAELGRDLKVWRKVRAGAMRGWSKCSDGRLYHSVVSEVVLEAWEKRAKATKKGKAGAEKRWGTGNATAKPSDGTGIAQAMPGDSNRREGKGIEGKEDADPGGSDGGSKDFAFEGRIVRLTEADLAKWRGAYHAIPDLIAELTSLDAFYDGALEGKDRKAWFVRCSTALGKKHQEWTAKGKAGGTNGIAVDHRLELDPVLQRQRASLITFQKHGRWYLADGPKPTEPGCTIDAGLLKEFGFAQGPTP